MTTLKYTFKTGKTLTASANRGNKPANWNPSGHHYIIRLYGVGKAVSFDFWDSYMNKHTGAPCDIRSALAAIASEKFIGDSVQDAADVMQEFGYDDPKEALRVFKGLQSAVEKLAQTDLTDEELQELADY